MIGGGGVCERVVCHSSNRQGHAAVALVDPAAGEAALAVGTGRGAGRAAERAAPLDGHLRIGDREGWAAVERRPPGLTCSLRHDAHVIHVGVPVGLVHLDWRA